MEFTSPFDQILQQAIENQALTTKEISGSQLNISYRKINNWHEQGLLPFDIPDGKWKSFSFLEACWVKVIDQLRNIGLPIFAIKNLKSSVAESFDIRELLELPQMIEAITRKVGETNAKEYFSFLKNCLENDGEGAFITTPFAMMLVGCFSAQLQTFLLIDADGNFFPLDESIMEHEEAAEDLQKFKEKPHISICLNSIISSVLVIPSKSQPKYYDRILSHDENELIKIMRSNKDAQQITVRLKKGVKESNIDLIEVLKTEKVDPSSRLTDILLKGGYEEITLITEKGILKSVKRKRKIKIKD